MTHFRQLCKTQETVQNREDIEYLKEEFQKEKETFDVVDHIICLSKKTMSVLQDDYKIKPEKSQSYIMGLPIVKSVLKNQR